MEALFHGYFTDGVNVGEADALISPAGRGFGWGSCRAFPADEGWSGCRAAGRSAGGSWGSEVSLLAC